MQRKRKSRRWPFVFALVGLLLFCVTVPRYWRSAERTAQVSEPPRIGTTTFRRSKPHDAVLDLADLVAEANAAAENPAETQAGSLTTATPSARDEELFAQLSAGLGPISPPPNFSSVNWPTPADVLLSIPLEPQNSVATATTAAAPAIERVDIDPQFQALFETVGRGVAEYRPESLVARVLSKAVSSLDSTSSDWPVIGEATDMGLPTADAGGPSTAAWPQQPAPSPAVTTAPPAGSALWSTPEVLVSQLEKLARQRFTAQWASETLSQLKSLVEGERRDGGQTAALLESLSKSAAAAVTLAERTDDEPLRVELLRAHWGLQRRLDCWTAMRDIRVAAISKTRIASRGELGPLYSSAAADSGSASGHLESLSADLEAYEQSRDPQIARHVAQVERQLRTSSDDLDRALADAVENNYRNANLRVAITADMLNRFVSQEHAEAQPVHERIAGTPIRGQSETMSRTRVQLQPTVGRWQMLLCTEGVVESDTSSVGRAKVFTHGSTQFVAQTPITVEADGKINRQPTAVAADNCNQLMGVTTGFDWVPLVGGLVRQEAASQYRQKRPQAKAEVEYKVESRTMERVDTRTDELVADVRKQVNDRLTNPLAKYSIEITPLEMTTTTDRVVARLRIAGGEQLAAHTPRPRALSDSLASVQVHESALTNAAVALELNGERLTASQLQDRLRKKMPRLALEQPPEAPDDTVFQFASKDAVQFHVSGGKLELTLSISEFRQDESRVRDFIVHAFYVPVIKGMTAELVRDAVLGIEPGQRPIGATDRALLHNVFNVVLAEDRHLPVFRPDNPSDPRLAGLMITQLVLEDGWLGVSIGPVTGGRVAERQRSLR